MTIFDRIVGQERAVRLLRESAADPSGAYLFVGPPGVGKADAATVFAAAILCPERCGQCSICSRVLRGLHPDVQSFEPEGYTYPVATIREIVASATQSPMEAVRRIFVVEEADRIVERSQNALLKALEEPGRSVTWILIAEALDPFLPTILSRCQIVEFAPVPEDALLEILSQRFRLDPAEAAMAVRAGRGDIDKTIALASDHEARALRRLAIEAASTPGGSAVEMLGAADAAMGHALAARQKLEKDHAVELEEFEQTAGSGRGTAPARKRITDRHKRALRRIETDVCIDFLSWLSSAFRDLAAVAAGASVDALINQDATAELLEAGPRRHPSEWLALVEACSAARLAIRENANAGLMIESVLLGNALDTTGAPT